MPNLGDIVGLVVSEMSIARVQSDLESLRIAQIYASHSLLRQLPIPRMRLPEVTIELPLIIDGADEPAGGGGARGRVDPDVMRKAASGAVLTTFREADIDLGDRQQELDALIAARVKEIGDNDDDPIRFADDVAHLAQRFVSARIDAERLPIRPLSEKAVTSLQMALQSKLAALRPQPPRLRVAATGSELRERATSENLLRLRLTIREDALEWISTDADANGPQRLVPE
jgi:hypothetical protein